MEPNQQKLREARANRNVLSCCASIVVGAMLIVVMAVGMGAGVNALAFGAPGAVIGLVCSPAMIFALRHGPWLRGFACVAMPSLAIGLFVACVVPRGWSGLVTVSLSVMTYVGLAVGRGVWGLKQQTPRPAHECPSCRYDCTGLSPLAVCPECGAERAIQTR